MSLFLITLLYYHVVASNLYIRSNYRPICPYLIAFLYLTSLCIFFIYSCIKSNVSSFISLIFFCKVLQSKSLWKKTKFSSSLNIHESLVKYSSFLYDTLLTSLTIEQINTSSLPLSLFFHYSYCHLIYLCIFFLISRHTLVETSAFLSSSLFSHFCYSLV